MTRKGAGGRARDGRLVELYNPGEISYWCKALGVSEEELRLAVDRVGTRAQEVRDYLARLQACIASS